MWARAAAIVVVSATFANCTTSIPTGSALDEPPPHGWSIPVEVDSPFTDGLEILRIADGHGPVTINRIEVLGTDALDVIGFQLAGPEREFGLSGHRCGSGEW